MRAASSWEKFKSQPKNLMRETKVLMINVIQKSIYLRIPEDYLSNLFHKMGKIIKIQTVMENNQWHHYIEFDTVQQSKTVWKLFNNYTMSEYKAIMRVYFQPVETKQQLNQNLSSQFSQSNITSSSLKNNDNIIILKNFNFQPKLEMHQKELLAKLNTRCHRKSRELFIIEEEVISEVLVSGI